MNTLVVDLKIPFITEDTIGAPAYTFTRYLPIGKESGITISEDGIDLLLWFDIKSTWRASKTKEEEIENHINVLAHYVLAEVKVSNISNDLADYMINRDFSRMPLESEISIQNEYEKLGIKILKLLVNKLNRLVEYARSTKGQYWLLKFQYNQDRLRSYYQSYEAKARINEGEYFRFQPGVGETFHVNITSEERYITKEEWADVEEFVKGINRSSLVLELLTGAEQLAGNGHARSALTEAVSALEVAIFAFGRSQDKDDNLSSILSNRLDIERLSKQIQHLGLSGSVRYLFPIILPEEILPKKVLLGCQEAIKERQNVVHNGKRNVMNVGYLINSIREFCSILNKYNRAKK